MTTATPLNNRVAAGLVFLTSGAVLVLEIAGLRLVGPYVGVTLETSSAIIGVALAAIAYGAWTGGWLADRRLDPAKLLSPLLLLGACSTAATLPIVRVAGEWLRGTDPTSVLMLAMLTLFVPAALLSAVTPLVIKLQLGDLGHTGRVVGHLATRELAEDVRRVLRPGGIYALNVIDGKQRRFIRAELATVAAVFPHVALIAPPAALRGETGSNFVVLGANAEFRPFNLPSEAAVLTGDALRAFIGDADVLTDDFAPVDQLLSWG